MNMGRLKDKYQRFKQWQRSPSTFHITSSEEHVCQCCGHRFVGNYCPCCSQKVDQGKINWRSVHQGVMDIWGLGTRSLIYSVWQLLVRPGYMIDEYINGKRQVSFPPVKMLFILAVIYSFIFYWVIPGLFHINLDLNEVSGGVSLGGYNEWVNAHYSWTLLCMSALAIFPTWIMFRYSPRNTRHTLPQGFFIQVFFAVIQVTLSIFLIFIGMYSMILESAISTFVVMIYYVVVYWQLFGYSLWGTLWRQAVVGSFVSLLGGAIVYLSFPVDFSELLPGGPTISPEFAKQLRYGAAALYFLIASLILGVGYLVNQMATSKTRQEMKLNAAKQSLAEKE